MNEPVISNINKDHSLILIGTVHGDPRGYDRAGKLLAHFKPNLITVEISRFSLRYRMKHGPRWQRQLAEALTQLPLAAVGHLAIRRLAAQVALPFEVKVASDYRRASGVPWRPLDLGGPARRHLPRYGPELLNPTNIQALLATADGSLEDYVAGEFSQARLALVRTPWRLPTAGSPEALRRERVLGRRLRSLASRYSRVVHLGGWEHLVAWEKGPCWWRDLADMPPRRMLLDEADRLP
jgi:hypothetical protein